MKKYTREMVELQLKTGNRDFSGCDLSGLILSGLDLSYANFTNADLSNTNLTKTKLINTSFIDAKLYLTTIAWQDAGIILRNIGIIIDNGGVRNNEVKTIIL